MRRTSVLAVLAAATLFGCAEELPSGSIVDRERVLGARVEVAADPERAWPMPGESVAVRWIVAAPEEPSAPSGTVSACAGDGYGCRAAPFLTAREAGAELALTVPPSEDLAEADRLWLLGALGETAVTLTIPLALDGPELANRNPALLDDAITLAGAPWTALALPAEEAGCASAAGDPSLPLVSAEAGEVELAVTARAVDREAHTDVAPDGSPRTRRETLQFSHYTTAGALERQFSVIDEEDDSDPAAIRVAWLPSEGADAVVPAAGLLARFTIVLRDGRGGLDVARRSACLVP